MHNFKFIAILIIFTWNLDRLFYAYVIPDETTSDIDEFVDEETTAVLDTQPDDFLQNLFKLKVSVEERERSLNERLGNETNLVVRNYGYLQEKDVLVNIDKKANSNDTSTPLATLGSQLSDGFKKFSDGFSNFLEKVAAVFKVSKTAAFFILLGIFIGVVSIMALLICIHCMRTAKFTVKREKIGTAKLCLDETGGSGEYGKIQYTLEYDTKKFLIKVSVMQVINLKANPGQLLDPYVVVSLLPIEKGHPMKFKTKIKKGCNDPVFNESTTFKVKPEEIMQKSILFSVYDSDPIGSDTLRGRLEIPVVSLDQTSFFGQSKEYITNLDKGQDIQYGNGDVCLVLKHNNVKNMLEVSVIEAMRIKIDEKKYAAIPPIWLKVDFFVDDKHHGSTQTKKKALSLDPYYNETFEFKVHSLELKYAKLCITGYFKNKIGISVCLGGFTICEDTDDIIGRTHMTTLMKDPRQPVVMWHKLLPTK